MVRLARVAILAVVALPANAAAHIALTNPPVRTTSQKVGPCGLAGSVRGATVTVLEPGSMLEVRWTETINHPSHYRISFDADGQDFTVPNDFMDFTQTTNVVLDNIADRAGTNLTYTQMIQLPSTPCENCTLQLFQMMYDKPPYTIGGDDIYFQCADIALRTGGGPGPDAGGNPAGPDAGTDPGDPGDGSISGGCTTTRGQGTWILGVLLALGMVSLRRRRHVW